MRLHFHRWGTRLLVVDCDHNWPDQSAAELRHEPYRSYGKARLRKVHGIGGFSGFEVPVCTATAYQFCVRCGIRRKKLMKTPRPAEPEPWIDEGRLPE